MLTKGGAGGYFDVLAQQASLRHRARVALFMVFFGGAAVDVSH